MTILLYCWSASPVFNLFLYLTSVYKDGHQASSSESFMNCQNSVLYPNLCYRTCESSLNVYWNEFDYITFALILHKTFNYTFYQQQFNRLRTRHPHLFQETSFWMSCLIKFVIINQYAWKSMEGNKTLLMQIYVN